LAIFGIDLELNKESKKYLDDTNERLKSSNLVKNPFIGKVVYDINIAVVEIKPVYFNFSMYIWLAAAISWIWFGLRWWTLLIAGIGFVCSMFWNKLFYYVMFRQGLKKAGYTGRVRLMLNRKTLERLIDKWDKQTCWTSLKANGKKMISGSQYLKSERT